MSEDWMPGDPQPVGPVTPEPAGVFAVDMHLRKLTHVQINACWAPGMDPRHIRLVHEANIAGDYVIVAAITPSNARGLASCLLTLADVIEDQP